MENIFLISLPVVLLLLLVVAILVYKLKQSKAAYRTLLSQKKSGEVVLGQISEQLAPFLDGFKYDPHKIKFLGMPIDYVYFGEDNITFIEIKSGKAQLSPKQKMLKDHVIAGRVYWDVHRIPAKLEKNKNG